MLSAQSEVKFSMLPSQKCAYCISLHISVHTHSPITFITSGAMYFTVPILEVYKRFDSSFQHVPKSHNFKWHPVSKSRMLIGQNTCTQVHMKYFSECCKHLKQSLHTCKSKWLGSNKLQSCAKEPYFFTCTCSVR